MSIRLEKSDGRDHSERSKEALDLSALLHPASAFSHPTDVIRDPDLTLNEKRAILASWASDACAVASVPVLRISPDGTMITFDDVMDALRTLDQEASNYGQPAPHYRRVLAHRKGHFRRAITLRSNQARKLS